MKVFTFCVGGGRENGPVDFGPCRAGTSTTVEILFTSALSIGVSVNISNVPRQIAVVPKQFVLNQSSKLPVKLTWTSKETKFQVLNETLNIEIQKTVQHLTLLGLATEKELNIFLANSNPKLHCRIVERPGTFFQTSPILADTAAGDTFITKNSPHHGSDKFMLLHEQTFYNKMMTHGSHILNNFTNSLIHTSYIATYEVFQVQFLTRTLPGVLLAAQKRYTVALPSLRRKISFRGNIASSLDQQCRSMLIPALESIDGAIFRLACDSIYRPRFDLASLLGFSQLNMAEVLLEMQQTDIIKQVFYKGSTSMTSRALTADDQRKNRALNCDLFIRIICFVDLCVSIYRASGILRPLQRHTDIITANNKQTTTRQTRTLTELINSYYSIVGTTGGISAILNELGFTWFNNPNESFHPISAIMPSIRSENIANFRTLLPHILLYMSHGSQYNLAKLKLPADTYEEIIANMKVFLSFCWQNFLMLEAAKGVNKNLASLPTLTNDKLNRVILTIIKENQMAGLLCSEKLFLASVNSTIAVSLISISCQQIYTRLKRTFNPSNSPIVRTIDRLHNEFKQKQEELAKSTAMLHNASVLDTIISGSKIDIGTSKRKHRTLIVTLKRHLVAERYAEFLLLALQMIALLHGYDLNSVIFEAKDCVNNGILLIMIARTILPTGQSIFPGKSLWKFNVCASTRSSATYSVANSTYVDSSDESSGVDDAPSPPLLEVSALNFSTYERTRKPQTDGSRNQRSSSAGDKNLTLSQIVVQQQKRDGYIKPNQTVLRLSDFYSCHLAFIDAIEHYGGMLRAWDYSLYMELLMSKFSILRVIPSFVYDDDRREGVRYSFSLFKLIDAYTRSMGSLLPNTSMLSYYVSMLFITAIVSNDYCLSDRYKLALLDITPEEAEYRGMVCKYAKSIERYRVRTRVDRRIAAIQAACRGFLVRQYYRRIKYSALVIQHMWRTILYQTEKGYLLTAKARHNLYLRSLLVTDANMKMDILSTEAGKRVLKAVLCIQRYARRRRIKGIIPSIVANVSIRLRIASHRKFMTAVRRLQRSMRKRSLFSFITAVARAQKLLRLSWKDVRTLLPTILRGPVSFLESCEVLESVPATALQDSKESNRSTALGFSTQYLSEGPHISIARAKNNIIQYEARVVCAAQTLKKAYTGYMVRRVLRTIMKKGAMYPRLGTNHTQNIYFSARWMQYHPADVLQVLLNRRYSQENRDYVLVAFVAEYHGILSAVMLIQAHMRGLRQRLRLQIITILFQNAFKIDTSRRLLTGPHAPLVHNTLMQIHIIMADAEKTLKRGLHMDQYMQIVAAAVDMTVTNISSVQAAFRGCQLRNLLYRVRCACCGDPLIMQMAIANGFNYYTLVDAKLLIVRHMRAYRQCFLVDKAISDAPEAIRDLLSCRRKQIKDIAELANIQNEISRAAIAIQAVTRRVITTYNIAAVTVITPLLFRFPIILDGLLLPTTIFRAVMLKHVVDMVIRIQSCTRGYSVRMRQQLLHIMAHEVLGRSMNDLQSSGDVFAFKKLVSQRLDLAICSPDDILGMTDAIFAAAVLIQAHLHGRKVRRHYSNKLLSSVQIIQREVRAYFEARLSRLLLEHKMLLENIEELALAGLVSDALRDSILHNRLDIKAIDVKRLENLCKAMMLLRAYAKGHITRARLDAVRQLSSTPCIFDLVWTYAALHSQLPPPISFSTNFILAIEQASLKIQAALRGRSTRARVQLIRRLSAGITVSNGKRDQVAARLINGVVLRMLQERGITDDKIQETFATIDTNIHLIQRTIRYAAFFKTVNLVTFAHQAMQNLLPLPFSMVIQFLWTSIGTNDSFVTMIHSSRRTIAAMYGINIRLGRIYACVSTALANRLQSLYVRLGLDQTIVSLLSNRDKESTKVLQEQYSNLLAKTIVIQAALRGYQVRKTLRTCRRSLENHAGAYTDTLASMLLARIQSLGQASESDITSLASLLLYAAVSIQRCYRGWRVRCLCKHVDKVILYLLVSRGSSKTLQLAAEDQDTILKSILMIQGHVRHYLHHRRSTQLGYINALLGNDRGINLQPYLCNRKTGKMPANHELMQHATQLKQCINCIQAHARGFLSRQSLTLVHTLGAYFELQSMNFGVLLTLMQRAGILFSNKDNVLRCPSKIEPVLTLVSASCSAIVQCVMARKSADSMGVINLFDVKTRCYIYQYIDDADRTLIFSPIRCKAIVSLITSAATTIQRAARSMFKVKRRDRAHSLGLESYFSAEELADENRFQEKKKHILYHVCIIQRAYRSYSSRKMLTQYANGDATIVRILMKLLDDRSSELPTEMCSGKAQAAKDIQSAYSQLCNVCICIQRVQRGRIARQVCSALRRCHSDGFYAWIVLRCLSMQSIASLTLKNVLAGIATVHQYTSLIQASARGCRQRSVARQIPAEYLPLLTRFEQQSGPVILATRCHTILQAATCISAHSIAYTVRKRLLCLLQYESVPPPDQIHTVLTRRVSFEAFVQSIRASLTIQRYARGFLTRCSVCHAMPYGTHLYLPQGLMTAPSQCHLLSKIIMNLIIRIQAEARRILTQKSVAYVKKYLDTRTSVMFLGTTNFLAYNAVADRVRLLVSSASLISIRSRAFMGRMARAYVQDSGLLNCFAYNFDYSSYGRVVKQVDGLRTLILSIQATARGFSIRNKISSIRSMLAQYGAVLDPILFQLVWFLITPGNSMSIFTDSDSYAGLVFESLGKLSLSPYDAVALISHSATLIQAHYRGRAAFKVAQLCRKYGVNFSWDISEGFANSILTIQAAVRGWGTRAALHDLSAFERPIFIRQGEHLGALCYSTVARFRAQMDETATTIERAYRGFLTWSHFKTFKQALGTIRHKPTRRALKATLPALGDYHIIRDATKEVMRFSAALHIQANYRGNVERKKIPSTTWRKVVQIRERLAKSMLNADKSKILNQQILIHKAILFKAQQPQNNPRSITKLNYFCDLYSPSVAYVVSKEFSDIIICVIEATITTPVVQHYNVFKDACSLLTKILSYNPLTYMFDTTNLTNFGEMVKIVAPKTTNIHTSTQLLQQPHKSTHGAKPPLMRLPDILVNAIDFHREDKDLSLSISTLLHKILHCAKESGYDQSHFLSEYEKLAEMKESGVSLNAALLDIIVFGPQAVRDFVGAGGGENLLASSTHDADEKALLISNLLGRRGDNHL